MTWTIQLCQAEAGQGQELEPCWLTSVSRSGMHVGALQLAIARTKEALASAGLVEILGPGWTYHSS